MVTLRSGLLAFLSPCVWVIWVQLMRRLCFYVGKVDALRIGACEFSHQSAAKTLWEHFLVRLCVFFRSWFTESRLPIKFTLIYVVCRLPRTQALMRAHRQTHGSFPNSPVFLSPCPLPPPLLACACSLSTISWSYTSVLSQIPSIRCEALTTSVKKCSLFFPSPLFIL